MITFFNRYKGEETVIAKLGDYSDQIYLLHALGINVYGLLLFVFPKLQIQSLPIRVVLITLFASVFSLLVYIILIRFYLVPMKHLLKNMLFKINEYSKKNN